MELAEAAAEARRLRHAIAGHKRAIKQHKDQLHQDATALADLEARCRALGIHLVIVNPSSGVGAGIHGQTDRHADPHNLDLGARAADRD